MEVLTEDLQNQTDLQTLANCLLLELSESNFPIIDKWMKEPNGQPLLMNEQIFLSVIYQKYQNRFNFKELNTQKGKPTVSSFIYYNPHIWTELMYAPQGDDKAAYVRMGNEKSVEIYYDNEFVEKLKQERQDKISRGWGEFDSKYIYTNFYYAFSSSLLHELQHAFDDYRSGGKAFDDKGREEMEKMKRMTPNKDEVPEEVFHSLNNQRIIKYLNLSHEVWARFTQTVEKTKFKKSIKTYIIGNEFVTLYEMIPFDKGPKQSLYYMNGWQFLEPDTQKRMMKAMYNIWQEVADATAKSNKEANMKIAQNPDAKLFEDKIPGGLSDKLTLYDIAKKHKIDPETLEKEMKKGKKVESEHTSDQNIAFEIAKDHLFEDPFYYSKLSKLDL